MKLISKIQYRKFDDDDESKKKFEGFAADENENIKRYERQVDLAKQLNQLLDVRLTKSGKLTKSQQRLDEQLQSVSTNEDRIFEIEKEILKIQGNRKLAQSAIGQGLLKHYKTTIDILKAEIKRTSKS